MSSTTSEMDVPSRPILCIGQYADLVVRIGSDEGPSIEVHFTLVSIVKEDCLMICHGVELVPYAYSRSYREASKLLRRQPDPSQDQEMCDLRTRLCTALSLRDSGVDDIMLRSEPPTTALTALAGLPVYGKNGGTGDLLEPEAVTDKFVRMHLLLTHLMMSMTSLSSVTNEFAIRLKIGDLQIGMRLYVVGVDADSCWWDRMIKPLAEVRHVVV